MESAICIASSFCDLETLVHISSVNTCFKKLVFENQIYKVWDKDALKLLIKSGNALLSFQLVENGWVKDLNCIAYYAINHKNPILVEKLLKCEKFILSKDCENWIFAESCKKGYSGIASIFLTRHEFDPNANNNVPIRDTDFYCQNEIVKLLKKSERFNPKSTNDMAIRDATFYNQTEIVKLLLNNKFFNPNAHDSLTIKWASSNGHLEIVKLLLQHENLIVNLESNLAICRAAYYNQYEILDLLLKDERFDPTICNNLVMEEAMRNSHVNIVKLLLTNGKIVKSLAKYNERINGIMAHKENLEIAKLLLAVMPTEAKCRLVFFGIWESNMELLKLLLKAIVLDPEAIPDETIIHEKICNAINCFIKENNLEMIKIVLNCSKTLVCDDNTNVAIRYGKSKIAELILNKLGNDTSKIKKESIDDAIKFGYCNVIEILLKYKDFDPSVEENWFIRLAHSKRAFDIVELLHEDLKVNPYNKRPNVCWSDLKSQEYFAALLK